jgi:phytoene dehydrogenase-like protein
MTSSYDAIVIGAGHNGLIAANYLARAGKRVLVLEARGVVGGACVTEELIPGTRWSSCAFISGLLRPEIIADLELETRFGLEMYQTDVLGMSLFRDGSHMFLHKDIDATLRELEKFSKSDARRFVDFGLRIKRFAELIGPWLLTEPPARSEVVRVFEEAGAEDLFDELVLMSTRDLLDRYFESEHIKGFFNFFGMISIWGGPSTPGTAYTYGHHSWGEFNGTLGQFGFVRGGMGGITQALARAAEHFGAEVRVDARVRTVRAERGQATGVELESGEFIEAGLVLSNADPRRSLLELLRPGTLDPRIEQSARRIDMRGSMARIHLLIDELPHYIGFGAQEGPQHRGQQILGASIENYEKAWEAERRGTFPDEFVIEAVIQSVHDSTLAPPGLHTMTLGVQQVPYELAGRDWDSARDSWADTVLEDLFHYAPNLRRHIRQRVVITPADLERDYLLTGGNIFHGAMFLDQLFSSRPLPGLSGYRTPVAGYYLCGAGTHPGGGVMGAPGHNAAKAALADAAGPGSRPASSPANSRRAKSKGLIERVMDTGAGGRVGYALARQRAFRPIARMAARPPKPRN